MPAESNDLFDLENKRLFQHVLPTRQEGGDGATESTLSKLLGVAEQIRDLDIGGIPTTALSSPADGEIPVFNGTGNQVVNRSLSAAGVAALTGATFTGALRYATAAGLTAGTTQTQGGGLALTADINEISTCATANDTVVLPTAAAGRCVVVINNGAETCQIFPASSDNLGQGVDTATTLAAGESATFVAYDATNWHAIGA